MTQAATTFGWSASSSLGELFLCPLALVLPADWGMDPVHRVVNDPTTCPHT